MIHCLEKPLHIWYPLLEIVNSVLYLGESRLYSLDGSIFGIATKGEKI